MISAWLLPEICVADPWVCGQVGAAASERDTAGFEDVAPGGEAKCGAGVLLDEHDRDAAGREACDHLKDLRHDQRGQSQ